MAFLILAITPRLRGQTTNFFLPKNPVAAAYILGRLSNQELIAAPRSEFVYVALLQRPGLDRKYRVEALNGLAAIHHTNQLAELLSTLTELDKKGEDSAQSLRELSPILLAYAPAELSEKRAALAGLANQSQLALTRQIAWAALITADKSFETAWKDAKPEQLTDLLEATPLIRDSSLRTSFYPKIEHVARKAEQPALRRAAITALSNIPAHEADTFKLLAALIAAGDERSAAVAGLQRIPQKAWPKEGIESLLKTLLEYLEGVPADERTGPDFVNALQLAGELVSALPAEQAQALAKTLRGLGPTIIVLRAVYEQMRYDKQIIVVEAGKPVALVLENEDAMPHNLVVLSAGSLEEIGMAAETMPSTPDAEGRLYIPTSPKVLHATRLVQPGQKAQLAFTAPSQPGDYPYVCTFPGHWRRMFGTMTVVQDLDAWTAAQGQVAQPKITEWKLEDLAPELGKVSTGHNLDRGQKLFTQLACAQCHKLGGQGYAFGPELTNVFSKYKNDRAAVLEQIIEPSKNIEERYRYLDFDLSDGESVIGMLLKEDAETITIQTGPADSLVQTLKKSEVRQRRRREASPMPTGLLNTLSKEEILDLLAWLETAGAPHAHEH